MRRIATTWTLTAVLALAAPALVTNAGAPPKKPKGATAQCKDGTYSSAKTQRGACSGHGGVDTWLGKSSDEVKNAPSTPRATAGERARTLERPIPAAPPAAPSARPQGRPTEAPENATAQCNDGTYSFAKQHRGACSGHQGVKTWFK